MEGEQAGIMRGIGEWRAVGKEGEKWELTQQGGREEFSD